MAKKSTGSKTIMTEGENIVRRVSASQPDWTYAEIKMTGRAIEDDGKISFMGTVKIERNKQVFIVLRSTLGFEVARAYANRDSVWITSKMLNIKEKGDWKLTAGKLGYPIDFFATQGVLMQSLFTSFGDQQSVLVENLVAKNNKENLMLVTNTSLEEQQKHFMYYNDFTVNKESWLVDAVKIHDIKGQWMADVSYQYNRDNVIKKIDLNGIDSERNFSLEINVVRKDIKDYIEIKFDKF